MKFSFIKNDKSTIKDELILSSIIVVCISIGVILLVLKPEFWIVKSSNSMTFGVLLILLGLVYIPELIYRFIKNDREKGNK